MSGRRAAGPSEVFFEARMDGVNVVVAGENEVLIGHRLPGTEQPQAGNWVAWHWDGESLAVTNDRYGGYPVYYAASPTMIAISPSIDVLLRRGVSRELDLEAVAAFLAAFLAVGYYFADDTPFRTIRALPPAATLAWRRGTLSLRSDRSTVRRVEMSRDAAIDGALELVRGAVERSVPDDDVYTLPISGGRDSRHLLFELIRAGHPPSEGLTTVHHATDWGGDPPFAARLCADLGLAHKTVSPSALVPDEWRKNRITSYCSDEHASYLAVADELTDTTSHSYDGLNGGTTLSHHYYTVRARKLSRAGHWDELASWMGKKDDRGRPRFSSLVSPDTAHILDGEHATARIRREFDAHLDASEPYLSLRFWNRTMRELSLTSSAMDGRVPALYTPFMDPELVRFASSIPAEHFDDTFHDEIIARAFPEHADIPYRPMSLRPALGRPFLREVNRDLFSLLRDHSDGSLVDRDALMRRAALGAVTGSDWFAWGRRATLTTYLVQLEALVAGRVPRDLPSS